MRDNVEVLANLLVAILAIGVSFAGVAMLVGSWFAIARRGRTDNIRTRAWRSLWPKSDRQDSGMRPRYFISGSFRSRPRSRG